jgi:hypothetical protein
MGGASPAPPELVRFVRAIFWLIAIITGLVVAVIAVALFCA